MNAQQRYAVNHPCYFGFETANPAYRRLMKRYSLIITVNAGYE